MNISFVTGSASPWVTGQPYVTFVRLRISSYSIRRGNIHAAADVKPTCYDSLTDRAADSSLAAPCYLGWPAARPLRSRYIRYPARAIMCAAIAFQTFRNDATALAIRTPLRVRWRWVKVQLHDPVQR